MASPMPKKITPPATPVKKPRRKTAGAIAWNDPVARAKAKAPVIRHPKGWKIEYGKEAKAKWIELILEALETGASLHKACRDLGPDAPTSTLFTYWVRQSPELTELYATSRMRGYLTFAEDLQEIADNPHQGITTTTVKGPNGVETKVVEEDMLGHRTLQIATRKWLLSKFLPKVFGDRIQLEPTSNEEVAKALKEIAGKLPV